MDKEPIEDEVEVVCSSCGRHFYFFILREHFEAAMAIDEDAEYLCSDCYPDEGIAFVEYHEEIKNIM